MGKKHSLTTDQKKRKKIITYYHLVKKKIIFSKKIFLFLLNLQKKTFPVLYKKGEEKKEMDKF